MQLCYNDRYFLAPRHFCDFPYPSLLLSQVFCFHFESRQHLPCIVCHVHNGKGASSSVFQHEFDIPGFHDWLQVVSLQTDTSFLFVSVPPSEMAICQAASSSFTTNNNSHQKSYFPQPLPIIPLSSSHAQQSPPPKFPPRALAHIKLQFQHPSTSSSPHSHPQTSLALAPHTPPC